MPAPQRRRQHSPVAVAKSNTWEAFVVRGVALEQWQYEVTAGGRIWFCPDPDKRIVRLVAASTGHPRATD